MRLNTPADVGAAIRSRRLALGLDQTTLAARIGVTRQWVINVEQGHPRAAMGLVLRAIAALDLGLTASPQNTTKHPSSSPDIDAIIKAAKKKVR